jgi:hypothetical protein
MPIQHSRNVTWGASSQLLLVHGRDRSDPAKGKTGLRFNSPGAAAAYVRLGEAAKPIALRPGRFGKWTPGGFIEIAPDTMPGLYQASLPDELFAEGATHAVVRFAFEGALVDPIDFEMVAYDPLEWYSIGILELSNRYRHAFLHGALPGLTQDEFERGEANQRRLTAGLRAVPPPIH